MMPAVRRPYSAGKRAGDQLDVAGEPRAQRLAEHAQALGQDDAVQAELQAVVLAADVQLAERILRHAGRLQDDLVERRVLPRRQGFDLRLGERVGRCADLRLDGGARRDSGAGR